MLQTTTTTFPLSALHLSPLNARQVTDPARVQDLIASMRSVGPLQNLVTTMETVGRKKKPTPGVVAGGRRLTALRALAEAGEIDADFPVRCELVPLERAIEISIAENTQREQMTPYEQLRAFKALADTGMPIEDTAASFGVTPLVVSRRLKLANLSPKLLALGEAGEATLEQLTALAVSDDHAEQEACWFTAESWSRNPHQLRSRLLGAKVKADSDPRALMVGVDAYRAAGGTLTNDLFADDGSGYLDDVVLLDQLCQGVLNTAADELRCEGWATVEIMGDGPTYHGAGQGYFQLQPAQREPTAEEAEQIAKLEAAINERSEKRDAIHEAGEPDTDEEISKVEAELATLEEQLDELEPELESLQESLQSYTAEQMAAGVALVYYTQDGRLHRLVGLTTKRPQTRVIDDGGDEEAGGTAGTNRSDQPRFHSERMAQALSSERSLAIAATLAVDPSLAMVAALDTMLDQIGLPSVQLVYDRQIKISVSAQFRSCLSQLPDSDSPEAVAVVASRLEQWSSRFADWSQDRDDALTFDWLLTLTEAERGELFAVCIAISYDVRRSQDHHARPTPLTRHVGLSMNRWWKPTASRYFAHLSKAQIVAVLKEAGVPTAGLDKLKKDALAIKAEELMAGSDWLPTPLRA